MATLRFTFLIHTFIKAKIRVSEKMTVIIQKRGYMKLRAKRVNTVLDV